ncbi:MAG: DUF4381 domain-containing protein [Magnetococcales bacterium]|nr:DUF4381 domain-containing protein [Magnetococcales bacterium]
MNPTPNPPLPLHDIHLPPPLSWWPPAPGWWMAAALVILLALLAHLLVRRYKKGALRRETLAHLEQLRENYRQQGDGVALSQHLSILLRRVALSALPKEQVAGLTGEKWLQFLDNFNQPDKKQPFQKGPGRTLLTAPYQQQVDPQEAEALLLLCQEWIEKHLSK